MERTEKTGMEYRGERQTKEEQAAECIRDAEMILVGIGEEFSPEFTLPESEAQASAFRADCLKSRFYEQLPAQHEILQAYNRLRALIGAKPYFVVTMNTDDLIFRSELEKDLIAAPCGSMGKLQCKEHIVEAAEIREKVLASGDESAAVCPVCGKPLTFHTVRHPGYLEEGYLPQWEKYTKWLSCTLNRRLCILELGVGFAYPQVIRFPFEKTAFFNKKATLVRINSKFPQLTEELSQKGVSLPENPVNWLNQLGMK